MSVLDQFSFEKRNGFNLFKPSTSHILSHIIELIFSGLVCVCYKKHLSCKLELLVVLNFCNRKSISDTLNHFTNPFKCYYFNNESRNIMKVYTFELHKIIRTIWYVILADRTWDKNWPHLTVGWPFAYISSTIHPT